MIVGENYRLTNFLSELDELCKRHVAVIDNLETMDVRFGPENGTGARSAVSRPTRRRKPSKRGSGPTVQINGALVLSRLAKMEYTKAEFGRAIGVSSSSIHRWIAGTVLPRESIVREMAQLLHLQFESLLLPAPPPQPPTYPPPPSRDPVSE